MSQIRDIEIVNIDGMEYPIKDMSDAAKQMVSIYNNWNKQEAEIRDKLLQIQAAKETMSRRIISQVRSEQNENKTDDEVPEHVSTSEPVSE